jgi:hypothetical protein
MKTLARALWTISLENGREQPYNVMLFSYISRNVFNKTIFQRTKKNKDINASLYFQKQINTDYGPCTFPTR